MAAARIGPWARLRAALAAAPRARDGSVAVEFAIVAIPFLMCVMACFEAFAVFSVSQSLDLATTTLARQIRTGQIQAGSLTPVQMEAQLCANLGWLQSSCAGKMYVDVRTFSSFGQVTPPNPVQNGQFNAGALQNNMGSAGSIVLVTAFFEWPLFTPGLDGMFHPLANGSTVITSRTAFRNEPYS